MSRFSTQLKASLEQAGISRQDLATKSGLPYSLLTNLVNDRRAPDSDSVEAICINLPPECAKDLLIALWCDTCPEKLRDLVHVVPAEGDARLEERQSTYSAEPDIDEELRVALAAIRNAAIKYPATWRTAVIGWSKTAVD